MSRSNDGELDRLTERTLPKCDCGSGEYPWWEYDARGIPLAKVCGQCRDKRLRIFRPEVLTNPSYECDEPIEPEDYY